MDNATAPPPAASPGEAARAAQEALAAPVELAGPKPRPSARLRLAAFLVALAAHLAMLYALSLEAPSPMAGGQGRLLDAVDISMVNSTALEARPDLSAPPASASPDAVQAKEGSVESQPAPLQPERKEERREPEKAPEEPPPPVQAVEAPAVVKAPQEEKSERKEASTPTDAGGAAARGDAMRKERQVAPAAASPGVAREYDGHVQAALARAKPKRGFGFGTVKVTFQLSPGGEVTSVEISKSSGNKRLDDAAVATVRRARFPKPPPEMTDLQRFYEFPIYFR